MTTFYEFQKHFPDDEACLHHMMATRYGGTEIDCPKCGVYGKFYRLKRDRSYLCQHCKHEIYPTAGTFMHRTHLPLHKWFFAMFLFSTSRHGVAAMELKRQLDIPYKTAWRMAHEIRKHMAEADGEWPLGGTVEVDETYVGGKRSGGRRGRGAPGKTVVFGVLERDGDVMAKVVSNVRKKTLHPIIKENVEKGSTVNSDELASYNGLDNAGFEHETVNHGAGEYVDGDCHVNGLEGFWARLKLSIRGTHVHVSKKHLQTYVKEFEYRYNRRKQPERIFGDLVANF